MDSCPPNQWPKEAFAPIEKQPSAPAWGILNSVAPTPSSSTEIQRAPEETQPSAPACGIHNSVAPSQSSPTDIQRAPEENSKCICACFCAFCEWKPCKCEGQLLCFNCLFFLGYSLFCLPAVYCCKYGPGCLCQFCWLCCYLCSCSGCCGKYNICAEDVDNHHDYTAKCVERFELAYCWPRMGCSLKCNSIRRVHLNCTDNPEVRSECGCFYGLLSS